MISHFISLPHTANLPSPFSVIWQTSPISIRSGSYLIDMQNFASGLSRLTLDRRIDEAHTIFRSSQHFDFASMSLWVRGFRASRDENGVWRYVVVDLTGEVLLTEHAVVVVL